MCTVTHLQWKSKEQVVYTDAVDRVWLVFNLLYSFFSHCVVKKCSLGDN